MLHFFVNICKHYIVFYNNCYVLDTTELLLLFMFLTPDNLLP